MQVTHLFQILLSAPLLDQKFDQTGLVTFLCQEFSPLLYLLARGNIQHLYSGFCSVCSFIVLDRQWLVCVKDNVQPGAQ